LAYFVSLLIENQASIGFTSKNKEAASLLFFLVYGFLMALKTFKPEDAKTMEL
jgi:hypothetical protein